MSDWEALVVDDCSTDNTAEVVLEFRDDKRIKLYRLEVNGGSGHARNVAASMSTAPLLMIADADDISLPHRAETQVRAFESDPNLSVLGGQVADFGSWGGPVRGHWPVSPAEIASKIRHQKMPVAHCAMMIRRSSFDDAGGYDEECRRAQDYALLRKVRTGKFAALDSVVVHYRTVRPIPFRYVILNGRYSRLARIRTRSRNPKLDAKVTHFPFSLITDARSTVTWARRRLSERAPKESAFWSTKTRPE